MPELPEVETIRLTLTPKLTGRTITGGEVLLPKLIQRQSPVEFLQEIRGRKILELDRRGKYLLIRLSGEFVIAFHLRMTGQLIVEDITQPSANATYLKLQFDNGTELRFRDQRKFGMVFLFHADTPPISITKLGPEPLTEDFSVNVLKKRLSGRKLAIKKALLNQEIIAGIGNIYADEALFLARLHPTRMANSLTDNEFQQLADSIVQVLKAGINFRGTTKRDYRDGEGKAGSFQDHLKAYGRKNLPCPNCGHNITRIEFGGRGTYFCQYCQK